MTTEAKATIKAFEKKQSEFKKRVFDKLKSFSEKDRTSALVNAGVLTKKKGTLTQRYQP